MIFRSNDSAVIWAVIAGIYGLCFGPLMYILYFIINGWHMVFAMWVSGIPYDITFCISNFILTLVLYKPLYRVMERYVVRET
jgi:energy-coupling factor transport system substrate-specific component